MFFVGFISGVCAKIKSLSFLKCQVDKLKARKIQSFDYLTLLLT